MNDLSFPPTANEVDERFGSWVLNPALGDAGFGRITGVPKVGSPEAVAEGFTGGDFSDLPGLAEIEELLLADGDASYLSVVINGDPVDKDAYTLPGRGFPVHECALDPGALSRLLVQGATIEFQRVERVSPVIKQVARALSVQTCSTVQVTAFITPPRQQAYGRHFDPFDVLVAQVHGSKAWEVWEPHFDDPMPHQNSTWLEVTQTRHREPAVNPLIDTVLERGHSLWIPRGWPHRVRAIDEWSIHYSFVMAPMTVLDVAQQALASAEHDANLRRAALDTPPEVMAATMDRLPGRVAAHAHPDALTEYRLRLGGALPVTVRVLDPISRIQGVRDAAVLATRRSRDDGQVQVHLGDRTVEMPAGAWDALVGGWPTIWTELSDADRSALVWSGLVH